MELIRKYKYSLFFWIVWLSVSICLISIIGLNLIIAPIIASFVVPIGIFRKDYYSPFLRIKKEIEAEMIVLDPKCPTYVQYKGMKITVENIGRSAAKECKCYFVTDKNKERVCWVTPAERPNAKINIKGSEPLYFCGFPMRVSSDSILVIPNEEGWQDTKLTGPEPLPKCKLLVTSENAEPVEGIVKIDFKHETIEIE